MSQNGRILAIVCGIFAFALIAAGGVAALAYTLVDGQEAAAQSSGERTVTVTGFGTVEVEPDAAAVRLLVTATGDDRESAEAALDEKVSDITNMLVAEGIDENDIDVPDSAVMPGHGADDGTVRVALLITVTVSDIDQADEIADVALEAGATELLGTQGVLENPEAALQRAREMALEDSRAPAENLATLMGGTVGEVVNITERRGPGSGDPASGVPFTDLSDSRFLTPGFGDEGRLDNNLRLPDISSLCEELNSNGVDVNCDDIPFGEMFQNPFADGQFFGGPFVDQGLTKITVTLEVTWTVE